MSLLPWRTKMFLVVVCLCMAATPYCLAQGGSGDNMTLVEDNAIVGFVMEQYTVFEGQVVSVCVSASMIMVNQTVEVMVSTQNDTALSGTDYEDTSEVLTFTGPIQQCVNISTMMNTGSSDDLQFTVMLTSSSSAELSPNVTTVVVMNVDQTVIVVQPMNVTVNRNETATFTVSANGTGLSYQWQRNGMDLDEVMNNDLMGVTMDTLQIMDVQDSDEGAYRCVITNVVDDDVISEMAFLDVVVEPTITRQPMSILNAVPGASATFSVVADGDALMYQWFRMTVDISETMAIENATEDTYTIESVMEDDEGTYFCTVSNDAGTVNTDMVDLMLLPQPIIDPEPVDGVVLVNDDITFSCTSDANINWTVVRDSNDGSVPFSGPDVDNTTSTITVSVSMIGGYTVTCTATNARGSANATATFDAIEIEVNDVTAGTSSTAVFYCNVTGLTGRNGIDYTWTSVKNGVRQAAPFPTPVFGNRSVISSDRRSLTIRDVGLRDADYDYACTILDTSRGDAIVGNDTASLTVNGPMITEPPLNQTLNAGETLELNCTAVNNPDATRNLSFYWVFQPFDTAILQDIIGVTDSRVTVTDLENGTFRSVFRIEEAASSDGGQYTCHVFNRQLLNDSVSASATVVVFFTPLLVFDPAMPVFQTNRNVTLRCEVTAQPNASFAEIARFDRNGERTVVANFSNINKDRMFFVDYQFTADFDDDDGVMIQCLAENANGPATLNATIIIQARPDPIDHMNDVRTELVSLNSVDVIWMEPRDNNAPITAYIISWCQFGPFETPTGDCSVISEPEVSVEDSTRLTNLTESNEVRFRITDLIPQQLYQVRIRARNIVGAQPNPMVGEGFNFTSAVPMDGTVVEARNITTSTVVILTWRLPSLVLATDGLNVSFIVSYFDNGEPNNIQSSVVESEMVQGFTITIPTGRRHTVNITANYSNPFLLAAPFTLTNIELAAKDTPLMPVGEVDDRIGANDVLTVTWPNPENTNFLRGFVVSYTSVSLSSTSRRRRRQASMVVPVDNPATRSAVLNFEPFSEFTVDVDALYRPPPDNNDVQVRLIPTTRFTTPQRPPGPPTLVDADNEGILKIRITWTPPTMLNGIIQRYWIALVGGSSGTTSTAVDANLRSWTSPNLDPDTPYTVHVSAETGGEGDIGAMSNTMTVTTRFGVSQPVITTIGIGTSDSRQFSITYNGANNALGRVDRIQVVVIRGGGIGNTLDIDSNSLLPQGRSPTNYYVVFSGPVPGSMVYVIGNEVTTIDGNVMYPNPPVDLDVDYQVFIRVYSALGDGTMFNDSVLTRVLRISAPLDPAVIIGPIAAIAVVLLLVLVILLLFVFIFTRPRRGYTIASTREDGRHGKRGIELRRTRLFSPVVNVPIPDVFTSAGQPTTLVCEASGTPAPEVVWTQNDEPLDKERFIQLADSSLFINDTDLKDEGAYIVTATNSAGTAEQMVRVTVIRPSAPEPDPDHPPIKVGEFTEKIALLRAEDDEGLEDEYSELEPDVTFTSYAAKININKNKNRYINIIPYDHSRVVLSLQDNTPGSDYINASYIDGFNRPNAYIATQGPQPSTFPDFWRMVWEFDCPTIVMVTNLKEEDKLKCHQYWPSYGTITYGSIQVTLKGVENLAEYSIRTFHITPIAGQSRVQMPVREVKQFHFLVWPDHGVPQFATPLLSFRKRVAKYHPDKKGPMVVHCSAGVGRTGTFITIDTMLRKMEQEGIIDIFNFVRHMRFRRNYMVQTGPQYVFIHDAMLEAIMCGDNSMPAPEVKKRFQELMDVDPESKKTRLQLQFENLNSNSPQDDDFDCTIATLPDNMAKNRFKVHLPANDYRVPLGAPPTHSEVDEDADEDEEDKEKEEPDYICASFADGYRQRNAFIITQAPMTSTTGDFWKMIWEQKSAAIVMLTELEEDGKEMSVKYWPSEVGEAGLFGSFQLELSEDEKDKGDYVTRKFKLSHVDTPQDCRIVTQFHFTKWPRTSVPSNPQSVIDLIDEIQRVQRKSGNQPITIHCDDGVSRTGAFCTLYSVLERVKVDQVVDIYLATKTLRIQRAGVLDTFDQYVFVHKAVQVFLESFSDYQNFK